MAIVSFETVAEAANALVAAGQRASVRAVIAHLGGGSPNAVLKYLREWKAGRPIVRPSDTTLDARITTAIVEQMQRVAVDAAAAAEERATGTEEDLLTLSEAQHGLEQQIASLTTERDTSRERAEALTVQLRELTASAEREHQHAVEQLATLSGDLTNAHTRTEQTVAQLAKVEVRLEALPELHAEIEKLRASLDTERKARVVAEQNAAVLAVKFETSEKRSAELDTRSKAAELAVVEAQANAKKAAEEAAELRGKVSVFEKNAAIIAEKQLAAKP